MDVARLMRAEVEAAETPSAVVNIERAMTAGRRQRWYARSAGAALAVVAVVVGAVTVPGLVAPPDGSSPPSLNLFGALAPLEPYTGKVPTPDTSRIPAALETIDPTVQYMRFGWLPSGLADLSYSAGVSPLGLGVSLSGDAGDPQNWAGFRSISTRRGDAAGAAGHGHRPTGTRREHGARARCAGAAATFTQYDVDGTDRLSLRWQYAPDGWAEVDVSPWAEGRMPARSPCTWPRSSGSVRPSGCGCRPRSWGAAEPAADLCHRQRATDPGRLAVVHQRLVQRLTPPRTPVRSGRRRWTSASPVRRDDRQDPGRVEREDAVRAAEHHHRRSSGGLLRCRRSGLVGEAGCD
ncbi:hypothetical protein NKG94_34995 [Micromonospora sp. M12]